MTEQENHEPLEIYTNWVKLNASPYEFILQFGLSKPEQGNIRPVANVRMSPQHAMALHILLGKFLDGYNDKFPDLAISEESIRNIIEDSRTAEDAGGES